MKEYRSTVTQRGQVTIPAAVRRLLGAKTGDKVAFRVEDGEIRLAPMRFTIETAFGSVKPLSRPEDFKHISRAAVDEHVARQIAKMQD
jgi:antitoxin PrlF